MKQFIVHTIVSWNTPYLQVRRPLDDVIQSTAPILGLVVGLALVRWWLW